MELTPGHLVSLLSKKTGASVELKIENGSVVVRTQDLEAIIISSPQGVSLETNGEVFVGRFEEDE
jgi:hypothetical protein